MKIYLDSIGCRLNQSEIEKFARQFRAAGHVIVDKAADADYVVVNTCAVTSEAASDSRQKIRQAARVTQGKVVVTGCWSTLDAAGARSLPKVSRVVANESKDHLVADLLGLPEESFDLEPVARSPLPGAHLRTRAFIKVQDGCDNHCTFCITPIARVHGRSRPVQDVLDDINAALDGGAQEVVLTGVHLGSWGQDFTPTAHLYDLVEAVLEQTAAPRLRLSSLEPWDLDEHFFSLWSDARFGSRLCRHLHLPLQSGSMDTLRRMARKTTPELFAGLVAAARAVSPNIAISTDVIVGFPGETEAEFAASLEFVRQMEFASGHVFSYSPRPGTAAARMGGQVAKETRKRRSAEMRVVVEESAARYRQQFIGAELDVLWEATASFGPQGWHLNGLTDNYLRVAVVSPEKLWNRLSRVRLLAYGIDSLTGEIIAV
jgi:threonylcarbamoyladenosine tRNA methylthiotransferase MtaB